MMYGKERDFGGFWNEWSRRRADKHCSDKGSERHSRSCFSPEMVREWRNYFHDFTGFTPEEHWAFGGRRFKPWHRGYDLYNPLVSNILTREGGLLPLVVLYIISGKPCYGNEIISKITELTKEQWVANPGAVYPLIAELEEEEFVTGKWEDDIKRTKRIYSITDKGREELEQLKAIIKPKLNEAVEVLTELNSYLV